MDHGQKSILIMSGHDYRSKRKVNIHFIADELSKIHQVRFVSLGSSLLSDLIGRDPKIGLKSYANRVELYKNVSCYLWRTFVHPFNMRKVFLSVFEKYMFDKYKNNMPEIIKEWVVSSSCVILETGLSTLFIDNIKMINPNILIIYCASDDLTTINASQYLEQLLHMSEHKIDLLYCPSYLLSNNFSRVKKTLVIRHGFDMPSNYRDLKNPFGKGTINAVSVGSMLFDRSFFWLATKSFPKITFHVIGSGVKSSRLPSNIKYYSEMKYEDTISYIQHCDFGIAPYTEANAPYYLSDTSMKLMQYEAFGKPSVCPNFCVGTLADRRFGYMPGDKKSIERAIDRAVTSNGFVSQKFGTWRTVVDRILQEVGL